VSYLYRNQTIMADIYKWRQRFRWRKPEDLGKTTDLSQVTDKLYHIMFYTSPWSSFELTTSVVIGTDCIGSCKSNYHTIMTTTAPFLNMKTHRTWTLFIVSMYNESSQWRATDRWFSPGTPVSATNETEHHDIAEILLKVPLNTIKQTSIIRKQCGQRIIINIYDKMYLSVSNNIIIT
jgi:hypothetical protein